MTAIEWLLDGDPAIRWQTMRDLVDAPLSDVERERSKTAHEGWARLLALQGADRPGNEVLRATLARYYPPR